MRLGKGGVTQVIERKTLAVMLPVQERDRFKLLAEKSGLPDWAYLSFLMGNESVKLDTAEDYLKAIHQFSSIAASLSAAMAVRFSGQEDGDVQNAA